MGPQDSRSIGGLGSKGLPVTALSSEAESCPNYITGQPALKLLLAG